jgi:ABC-type branched-subunit amino acid transport system permease subunit
MDFLYTYIVLAEIYVLLGLSTNLLVGIVGIFSVSQAAVFGVGAYIVAHFGRSGPAAPTACPAFRHPMYSACRSRPTSNTCCYARRRPCWGASPSG